MRRIDGTREPTWCYVRAVADDHLVAGSDDLPSHMVPIDQGGGRWGRSLSSGQTGFLVAELDAFGAGSVELEEQLLRDVARDPRFREAVTWQNRAAAQCDRHRGLRERRRE
jgi:hypothetical protein